MFIRKSWSRKVVRVDMVITEGNNVLGAVCCDHGLRGSHCKTVFMFGTKPASKDALAFCECVEGVFL